MSASSRDSILRRSTVNSSLGYNSFSMEKRDGTDVSTLQPQTFSVPSSTSPKLLIQPAWQRWLILAIASTVTLGSYYSFDFPSVLHNQFNRHMSSSSDVNSDFEWKFSLLFTLYSLPNTFLPYFGGLLADYYGNPRVMLTCSGLVFFGNILFTIGLYQVNWSVILFGRFLFGLGAETLTVTVNTLIAKWFSGGIGMGSELALALGINLSGCKLGGVLTALVSPILEQSLGLPGASLVVTALCGTCFVVTFGLNLLEVRLLADVRRSIAKQSPDAVERYGVYDSHVEYNPLTVHDGETSHYHQEDVIELVNRPKKNGFSHLTQDDVDDTVVSAFSPDEVFNKPVNENTTGTLGAIFRTLWVDLQSLGSSMWLLCGVTLVMYGTFVPFNVISNAVLIELYLDPSADTHDKEIKAARLQSIPYMLTVFVNPALGILVDWLGERAGQLAFSSVISFIAQILLYSVVAGPIVPLLLIGAAYSIFGCVSWACVPLVVPEPLHGTAYGLMGAFQNIGQSVIPLVVAAIHRTAGEFRPALLLFASLACISLLLSCILWFTDNRSGKSALKLPSLN